MRLWPIKVALVSGASALASAALFPSLAKAAEAPAATVGELVVTAEKREEQISRLPIAVSAYSGETLEKAGVEGVRDLQAQTPSLQVGVTGAETYLTIRGVGSEIISIGSEPGVSVSQDGVVLASHLLFDTDFLDVARVEVLRGPQGTISGRNSTGGAINIISQHPTATLDARLQATVGNYSRFATEGFVSGPLSGDRLMGRLAFSTDMADGWLTNTFLNEKQGSRDKLHGRVSLLAKLSERLEALFLVEGVRDRSLPQRTANFGRARPDVPSLGEVFGVPDLDLQHLTFQANQRRDYARNQYGVSLRLTWKLGDGASLTSTSGYWKSDINEASDTDGTLVSIGDFPLFKYNIWQASQELTLTADLTDRLDLVAGGLYLRESAEQPLEFVATILGITPGLFVTTPDQDLTSYAGYGQVRYRLSDKLRASVGLRYTHDRKTYFEHGFIFGPIAGGGEASWSALTPRFSLDYQPNPNLTLFANVARGFKAGGFNTLNFNPVDIFNPEYVWSYEAGLKANGFDHRIRVALTAFYMDYTDLQQIVFKNVGGAVVSSVENAAAATVKGIEFELDARPTERLRLGFSGSLLDARFDKLVTADSVYPELGVRDLSGNRLARSPKSQFTVSGEYSLPVGQRMTARLRADYNWRAHQFFDFFNHELVAQKAYGLLNLSASLESVDGRWSLTAFGRNVTDERYLTNALASVILPGVPMNLGNVGEPRMYGLSLSYRR